MAIKAPEFNSSKQIERKIVPQGNHIARCYGMIEIGTVTEMILGEKKTNYKVLIDWELPLETTTFSEEKGEQPFVYSKEFTLSMHEKSNLRGVITSWRGKPLSDEEAKTFDLTKLVGATCMLNIVHRKSKDGTKTYPHLAGVTPLPKGFECPAQVNPKRVLEYDKWDQDIFMSLPTWLSDKIAGTKEYEKKFSFDNVSVVESTEEDPLPF